MEYRKRQMRRNYLYEASFKGGYWLVWSATEVLHVTILIRISLRIFISQGNPLTFLSNCFDAVIANLACCKNIHVCNTFNIKKSCFV